MFPFQTMEKEYSFLRQYVPLKTDKGRYHIRAVLQELSSITVKTHAAAIHVVSHSKPIVSNRKPPRLGPAKSL
jgi:hypothetical protein